jgi:hypothetical protein
MHCLKVVVFDPCRSSFQPSMKDDSFHHGRIVKFREAGNLVQPVFDKMILIGHFGLVAGDRHSLHTAAFD